MSFLIGTLFLSFALTACASPSKQDSVPGDADKKIEQQEQDKAKEEEQYKTWWQSLTPEQRAREIQRQHERALVP